MTILSFSPLSWRAFFSPRPLFRVRYAPSPAQMSEDFSQSELSTFPHSQLQNLREDYLLERRFIL
ncbi:hypothetical protein GEI7407_3597 [Geitlerinema sp. PCC 7407]|nr:hypothetical protein GEI7407_3597 [Geitlerinema sp. PCC 7407]